MMIFLGMKAPQPSVLKLVTMIIYQKAQTLYKNQLPQNILVFQERLHKS